MLNRIGIRSNEASRQVVDDSTVQMFVRFLSEKVRIPLRLLFIFIDMYMIINYFFRLAGRRRD